MWDALGHVSLYCDRKAANPDYWEATLGLGIVNAQDELEDIVTIDDLVGNGTTPAEALGNLVLVLDREWPKLKKGLPK